MKMNKIVYILFTVAALCFVAGAINHAFNTGEGVVSSLLLSAGCLCMAVVFYKKK